MTMLEDAPATGDPKDRVDYGLYDADQHYYEAEDALTRYLDPKYRSAVKWVQIGDRRTMLVNDKLVTVVPNPNYDPVGAPGSLEKYFRAETEGMPIRDIVEMQRRQPEYTDRDERIKVMDEQGVDFAYLVPSLGLGLEEMLYDDPETLYAVFRAYNEWLDDDWGYDRDGRIQTGPMISLVDPEKAAEDTRTAIDKGARMLTFRPAPVATRGVYRSPGDEAHDPVWAMAAEAGVVIGIHGADSGYGMYKKLLGEDDRYTGLKMSKLEEVLSLHIERPVFDMIAMMICHGVLERHPTLKVATLELGAAWVRDMIRRLKKSYGKTPQLYGRDPVESFHEQVWVAPFYEDDIGDLRDVIGADRILLGSDWPHPEGLATPRDWIGDFASLPDDELRLVLRENLKELSGR